MGDKDNKGRRKVCPISCAVEIRPFETSEESVENDEVQTDISVFPYVVPTDSNVAVLIDAPAQTAVTCKPTEPECNIAEKLATYHSIHAAEKSPNEEKPNLPNIPLEASKPNIDNELLAEIVFTMKALTTEVSNLKSLCSTQNERPEEKLEVPTLPADPILTKTIEESIKYEYDLLTEAADEFPQSIVITDQQVPIEVFEFKVPARSIRDFEEEYTEEDFGVHLMMDTNLLVPKVCLDRTVFNKGSSIPVKESIRPMLDTNLKGGIVPIQLGITKRRDITIFLEDLDPEAMLDKDLLVEPEKVPCQEKLDAMAQFDFDLGPCTPTEKGDSLEQTRDDVSERVMFDFDLCGKKCEKRVELENNLMYDYNLPCPNFESINLECTCQVESSGTCKCGCNVDCASVNPEEGLVEYRISEDCGEVTKPSKRSSNHGAMFDIDLGCEIFEGKMKCTCHPDVDFNCSCGCQLDTISVENGYYVGVYDCGVPPLAKDLEGNRAMFDFDLEPVVKPGPLEDASKYLQCRCKGDSVPKAMLDCDIGTEFEIEESDITKDNPPEGDVLICIPWDDILVAPITKTKSKLKSKKSKVNAKTKLIPCPTTGENKSCGCRETTCKSELQLPKSAANLAVTYSEKLQVVHMYSCSPSLNESKESLHEEIKSETQETQDIVKAKVVYKISKPEIIDATSGERTIRTKIHILPESNCLKTTASQTNAFFENEIRPLREALIALQEKIKNLPECQVKGMEEPIVTSHFQLPSQRSNFGKRARGGHKSATSFSTIGTPAHRKSPQSSFGPEMGICSAYRTDPDLILPRLSVSQSADFTKARCNCLK